jgi:amidase
MNPFATAAQIVAAIRCGETSAVAMVALYRERHERLKARVNAIVTPDFDSAIDQARRIDASIADAGPLAGLPITIKDGIHVAGLPSTGGMIEPARATADADAPNVQRLRAAGAVILGKTNTPVANADWQAVNDLFGRSRNPWNAQLTPGGSTGGGAAAVAAGLSAAELGSDIGGSIRVPAAFCGLFGHKPSDGVIANSGHFPRQNLPNAGLVVAAQGPLARSAEDLKILVRVLCAPDGLKGKGWRIALPPARCQRLAGCRIGIPRLPDWMPVERSILEAQQALCDVLAKRGARVVDVDLTPPFGDLSGYYVHYLTHLQCVLGGALPAGARARAAVKMRAYQDRFLDAVADGLEGSAGLLMEMLEISERYKAQWEPIFEDIDVLLSAACCVNAFPHDDAFFYDRTLDIDGARTPYYRLSAIPALASLAGLPATVFPTGRFAESGAPIGLQVMGAYLEDWTTLEFAHLVEAEIGGFIAPPGFE